jgi:hypothetical protein
MKKIRPANTKFVGLFGKIAAKQPNFRYDAGVFYLGVTYGYTKHVP